MYLTYDEYQAKGGELDNPAFIRLEFKACKLIDTQTFSRIKTLEMIPDEIRWCVFELIETGLENVFVAAESNDGVSTSYEQTKNAGDIIREYLSDVATSDGTSVLYCGVV